MTTNGNGRRYLWTAILSAVLNVILFGYISLGFWQDQEEGRRAPLERDVAELARKSAEHDADIKALEVALEGIRQQLWGLREDVKEIKEAVK